MDSTVTAFITLSLVLQAADVSAGKICRSVFALFGRTERSDAWMEPLGN